MRTFTEQELKEILRKHKLWLEDSEQQDAERANLRDADLRGANLRYANLCDADLCGANLCYANLCGANLCYANLRDADLCGANLCGANLCYANLCGANLCGANLRYANLCYANLCGANLCGANLRYANLCDADLCDADLCDADLCGADLCGANLCGAKNTPFIPYACPDVGSFIGYKKANGLIVELEILSDAKRVSATGRKCRCDKAKVLSIQNIDGTISDKIAVRSNYCDYFIYKVGEIVAVDNFDDDRWNECSTGIHFFINRQEAVNYI